MIDINRAMKVLVNTGKVTIGVKETKKALGKGNLKMVILASNSPEKDFGKVPAHTFKGNNADMGAACGKPFPVAVLGVIEEGQSGILSIGKSD